jgi:hypothetical protein
MATTTAWVVRAGELHDPFIFATALAIQTKKEETPMQRILTATAAAGCLLLAGAVSVTANPGALAQLFQPAVIDVAQDVPLEVVFALPQEDGTVITVTAPITVGLAVQVKVQGPQVVEVTAAATDPAGAATAGAKGEDPEPQEAAEGLTDTRGIPYDVQTPDGLVLTQVNSKDMFGSTQIVGQIRNDSDESYRFISVNVSLYDADGNLIDVAVGGAQATELDPGETTTFQSVALTELDTIAGYSVQVEGLQ